jgi:micrococcal nuclease
MDKPKYVYIGRVDRVVDGDTVDATIDCGFGIYCSHRFRLHGVDTPETWRPSCEAEKVHGESATAYVKYLLEGRDAIFKTYKLSVYGRYESEIWTVDVAGNPVNSLADLLAENDLLKRDKY